VLVDRGSCLFVEKIRLAVEYGAAAVIVANTDQENSEQLIEMASRLSFLFAGSNTRESSFGKPR
jgi:hypothetical protein